MTLIGAGGQPLTKDEGPHFEIRVEVICPRDNTKLEVTGKVSGLAPISLTQFFQGVIPQVANGMANQIAEHETLHSVSQSAISQKEGN